MPLDFQQGLFATGAVAFPEWSFPNQEVATPEETAYVRGSASRTVVSVTGSVGPEV